MKKEYNYCPYCGEHLNNNSNLIERKPKTSIDDIDTNELDEREIVIIDLKRECMRVPYKINSNYNISELDKKRQELINELKKLRKE